MKQRGRRLLRAAVVLLWCGAALFASGFAMTVRDAQGRVFSLPKPAHRVVSLAPNLTEILFAIGAGDTLIARSAYSDYPAAARELPIVATATSLSIERILTLHPDLIVVWDQGTSPAQIASLVRLHLPVLRLNPHTLSGILAAMDTLARLTGRREQAQPVIAQFASRLAGLRTKYRDQAPLKTFYEAWPKPLFTVNRDSIINDVMTLCGGVNIFADLPNTAAEVSVEGVLAKAPRVIVSGSHDDQWQQKWLQWPRLPAVASSALFTINPDWIARAGPRTLLAAQQLCQDLAVVRARHSTTRPQVSVISQTPG